MLTRLSIRNIAVVEEADISFGRGFSVLTGETGAGKSMIIDAVRMILGDRMSRDIIRTGEKKASVYAEFTFGKAVPDQVRELADEDGNLRLYRELSSDGKNLCRVNDASVGTAFLRAIGEKLVDIHGQHDSRNLLDPSRHIEYIDTFAALDGDKAAYRVLFLRLKGIAKEIKSLEIDEGEKLRRIEMLDYQIAEIEAAAISPGEEEKLKERRDLLANAEKIAGRLRAAISALSGNEEGGALEALRSAASELSALSRFSDRYEPALENLQNASYVVEDVLATLETEADGLDFSPKELDELEDRLDQIYRLKRKYGATEEDVLAFLEKAKEERAAIAGTDQRREELTKEYAVLREEVRRKAHALSENRKKAAARLSTLIEKELAYLDMPHTRFRVEFYDQEEDGPLQFHGDGIDSLEFFLSVNRGESLKPLSKTASGGELSRIMLAMKNVLTDKDSIPVQIFDEIDTGISGRAAQKVADKLWLLARGRQVLCVTHLSQLAAMADADYLIEKKEKESRTSTGVRLLDEGERKREIARINVGAEITDLALSSAGQMLEACRVRREVLLSEAN